MPMVWPSGDALATISEPITPPAPDRLSAITGWPRAAASFAPTARDKRSVVPPAANGTMIRIGLVGYCAEAGIAAAANETASASADKRFPIPDLLVVYRFGCQSVTPARQNTNAAMSASSASRIDLVVPMP